MRKGKIVCAGHVCVDLTPAIVCAPQRTVSDVLVPGRLVPGGTLAVNPGGCVVNTGLAMRRFGAESVLIGKIGSDVLGEMLLGFLEEHDAARGMVVHDGAETSYSVVIAVPGLDRIFIHNSGANDAFTASDVDRTQLQDCILFHFGYPPLMASMYADSGEELVSIFQKAEGCGALTSLDMAAIGESSPAGDADWETILGRVLPHVDFFLPSFEEICYALDRDLYRTLRDRAGSSDIIDVMTPQTDAAALADRLIDMGCAFAMIKCGAKGFWFRTAGREAFERMRTLSGISFESFPDRQGFVGSYVPRKVVSGTGAGDCTIAAFLTAMTQNKPLDQCLELAAAAGAACVESVDALSALVPISDLEVRIEAGWAKNDASHGV